MRQETLHSVAERPHPPRPFTFAAQEPYNESIAFLHTYRVRPDIAMQYGDVGGPNVYFEASRVRSQYEQRVRDRLRREKKADKRWANVGMGSSLRYNIPFTIKLK